MVVFARCSEERLVKRHVVQPPSPECMGACIRHGREDKRDLDREGCERGRQTGESGSGGTRHSMGGGRKVWSTEMKNESQSRAQRTKEKRITHLAVKCLRPDHAGLCDGDVYMRI